MSIYDHGRTVGQFQATGAGTNAGVVVEVADPGAGLRHVATHISFSGDLAAVVTLESPNGTVLWRQRFAAAFVGETTFPDGLRGGTSEALRLEISASTANCEANISGHTIVA